jgi:predicted nucleotidyltransferase
MKPSVSMARHGSQVRTILDRFRMRNPRIFGSVARGADVDGSDLDILVEAPAGATFYDLARAELELEEVLGCRVEVLTRASLAPDIADNVEADLAPLP